MARPCGWATWRRSGFSRRTVRNVGLSERQARVLIIVFRQPGANIIDTVDRVRALLPQLQVLDFTRDRRERRSGSHDHHAGLGHDIEITLLISVVLVILVVFAFLRTVRATIIPSIAVPLSLVGTFGVMYLLGYSLDNLSLMALAISTGFRGGRCHRCARKHHAPPGGRDGAGAGGFSKARERSDSPCSP